MVITDFLAYSLAAVMVLIGVIFRRSRMVTFLLLLYMWVLVGLNTYSPDYSAYQYIYENTSVLGVDFEPLFSLFCQLCSLLGFTYQQFRMVYALLLVLIVYKAVRLYTEEINFVLGLFIILPFLSYASGLRMGMAAAIACYAFRFLLDTNKHSGLKYVILILISACFQYVALFYLVFLLGRRMKRNTILGCLVISPVLIVLYYTGVLYEFINLFTDSYRILHWFEGNWSEHLHLWLIAVIACTQFAFMFCIDYSSRELKHSFRLDLPGKHLNILTTETGIIRWQRANYLLLFLAPLYLVNVEFLRLFLGTMILEFSQMANAIFLPRVSAKGGITGLKYGKNRAFIAFISLFVVLWGFVFFECIMYNNEAFLPAIFKDNMMVNMILYYFRYG